MALAVASSATVLAGKFRLDQPLALYAGLAALLAATAWGALKRRNVTAPACTRCAAGSPPSPLSPSDPGHIP